MALGREKFKVYNDVFDEFTIRTLQKLSSQGYFEELESSLSQGKEAHIFTASRKDGTKVIVKIYRLQNCNFNKMFSYIRTDPRFMHLKGRKRQIIFTWVQREFRNLLKAREVGVRVPTAYTSANNVIVMEYAGDEVEVAPQVKDAIIENPDEFVKDVIHQTKLLYQKAKIVHGDLSFFNILCQNQKPVIIDMSQSTQVDDPNAHEYFDRDVHNIVQLAKRIGVSLDPQEVKQEIQSSNDKDSTEEE
jgi:RIO kinase 1